MYDLLYSIDNDSLAERILMVMRCIVFVLCDIDALEFPNCAGSYGLPAGDSTLQQTDNRDQAKLKSLQDVR